MIRFAFQSDIRLQDGRQTGWKVKVQVRRLARRATVEVGSSEDLESTHKRSQNNGHGLDYTADPLQMENLVLRTSLEWHLKSPVGPVRAGVSQRCRWERVKEEERIKSI